MHACMHVYYLFFRSTPVETLHTILLGPYKYLLREFVPRLSPSQKRELQATISAFNYSGLGTNLDVKLLKHYKSFVGRNFKSLAQCALFIFRDFFSTAEMNVWIALSKVSCIYSYLMSQRYGGENL